MLEKKKCNKLFSDENNISINYLEERQMSKSSINFFDDKLLEQNHNLEINKDEQIMNVNKNRFQASR